jgi:DNA segregation ATPase FtsK/SpoIIIE-like protein
VLRNAITPTNRYPGNSMTTNQYHEAVAFVVRERRAGASVLKQQFRLSDSKVQRYLKQMEKDGILSSPGIGGAREVLRQEPSA